MIHERGMVMKNVDLNTLFNNIKAVAEGYDFDEEKGTLLLDSSDEDIFSEDLLSLVQEFINEEIMDFHEGELDDDDMMIFDLIDEEL